MKTMIVTLLAVTALSASAHALQIKQATDNGQITAIVSAQEISRISLTKDRIRMAILRVIIQTCPTHFLMLKNNLTIWSLPSKRTREMPVLFLHQIPPLPCMQRNRS